MRSPWPAGFYLMYMARRILFVWVVFNLEEYSGMQLLILNMMNLIILMYVAGSNPIQERFRNRLEIFNELFVCYCTQHMYFYTDWVLDKHGNPDENVQWWYGVLHNCFFGYYIYANLGILVWVSLKRYYLAAIACYRKCKFYGWEQEKPYKPQYIIQDPLDKIMKKQYYLSHKNLIEPHFEGLKEKYEPEMSVVIEEDTIKEETPDEIEASETKSSQDNKGLNFAEFMDQLRSKPEVPAVRQNFADFMDRMKTGEVEPEVEETTNLQTTTIVQNDRVNFAEYMDKMNSQEVEITTITNQQESTGGGGFAEFMDNMKSKLTVTKVEEEKEVRKSGGNGRINFAEYMDNMNSKANDGGVEISGNAGGVREVEMMEVEESKRISGQGGITKTVIIEQESARSKAEHEHGNS